MALVKKHWKLAVFNCLLVLAAAALLAHRLMHSRAVAEEPPPPATQPSAVDAVTFCRVQELRGRLFLSNRDLAALGCTQEQAADILSTLLQWHGTNQGSFQELEQSLRTAQQQLAEATRRVSAGPRDTNLLSQVRTLQQQVLSTISQRQALIDQAVSSIQGHFTSPQQQLWQTARSHASAPERYRYLSDLSSANSTALAAAAVKYGAGSPQMALLEQAALGQQLSDLSTTATAIGEHITAVIAAETTVLPQPEELKALSAQASIQ